MDFNYKPNINHLNSSYTTTHDDNTNNHTNTLNKHINPTKRLEDKS